MKKVCNRQPGFSLTEMLIATGIMTVGLVMIATIFPVGVKLTSMSAERSIAAVAADEAFAKVRLYGLRDFADWPSAQIDAAKPTPTYADSAMATYDSCDLFKYTTQVEVFKGLDGLWETQDDLYFSPGINGLYESTNSGAGADDVPVNMGDELMYPSTVMPTVEGAQKYHWSALCRRTGLKDVQVTVFVTHTTFAGVNYYAYPYDAASQNYFPTGTAIWPAPIPVNVAYDPTKTTSSPLKELEILPDDAYNLQWGASGTVLGFFGEGYTIVNNRDGKIYRILEMKDTDDNGTRETMVLYTDWQWAGYDANPLTPPGSAQTETVWVVPPGVGSDRYPCVGVFQQVMHFDNIN